MMLKRGFILLLLIVFAAVAAAGPAAAFASRAGERAATTIAANGSCADCADCDTGMGACPASCAAPCKQPVPAPAAAFALQPACSAALHDGAAAAPRGRLVLPDPRPPRAPSI